MKLIEAVAKAIGRVSETAVPTKLHGEAFRDHAKAAISVARPIIERELLEAMMKDAKLLQILNVQRFLNQHARERGIELEE